MTAGDGTTRGERWHERLPIKPARPWIVPVSTAAILTFAIMLRVAMVPIAPTDMAFVTVFPAVLLICFLFGARAGAIAALVGGVIASWLFVHDPLRPGLILEPLPAVLPYALLVALNLTLFHRMQRTSAKLRSERERSAALAETRATLFRELQHRVSNNLTVAASLLSLQKRHVIDPVAQDALEEAVRRLAVIGRVSRQLYEADRLSRPMRDLLEPLCGDVLEMSGREGIAIDVQGESALMLDPDVAIPLALIVAEAVANAIEHGFAGRDSGRIEVVFHREEEGLLCLEVRDDGHGLPEGFDLTAGSSLGLGIVRSFADRLGGSFELVRNVVTVARLRVPYS